MQFARKMSAVDVDVYYEFGPKFEFICDVPIVAGALAAPIEEPVKTVPDEPILQVEVIAEGSIANPSIEETGMESGGECSDDDVITCPRYTVLEFKPIPTALAPIPGVQHVWNEMKLRSSKWNLATLTELYKLLVSHILLRYRGIEDWRSCKQDEAQSWSARCQRIAGETITPTQVQEWVRNTFKRTPFKNWMKKLDDVVLENRNHSQQCSC